MIIFFFFKILYQLCQHSPGTDFFFTQSMLGIAQQLEVANLRKTKKTSCFECVFSVGRCIPLIKLYCTDGLDGPATVYKRFLKINMTGIFFSLLTLIALPKTCSFICLFALPTFIFVRKLHLFVKFFRITFRFPLRRPLLKNLMDPTPKHYSNSKTHSDQPFLSAHGHIFNISRPNSTFSGHFWALQRSERKCAPQVKFFEI